MKALFWAVAIIALAVAVTLAARHNSGYVLAVWPPYRVELSINFVLAGLAVAFLVAYGALRALSAVWRLPGEVGRYRLARRRERARARLTEALNEYFAGRYARAEKAAAAALEQGEQPALAAVVAARAAHELRAYDRRDAFLARIAADQAGEAAAAAVTAAELLSDEGRHREALEALSRLPQRHTAALRLELAAHQQLRNWGEVPKLAEALRARRVFDAVQADEVRRRALIEDLRRKAADPAALGAAWDGAPAADRRDRRVAAVAAQCFIAQGECDRAQRVLEEALEAQWDSDLVALYADCPGGDGVRRIERAEAWLKEHPRDAALLYTLGRLCAARELWGKAQSYLDASLSVEPTHSAHLAMARLQERLGNGEAAQQHFREGLEQALVQLRAATGGRRRAPL